MIASDHRRSKEKRAFLDDVGYGIDTWPPIPSTNYFIPILQDRTHEARAECAASARHGAAERAENETKKKEKKKRTRPVIDEVRARRAKKSATSRAITHSYSPSILIIGRRAEVVHSDVKRARAFFELGLIKKRNNDRRGRGHARVP